MRVLPVRTCRILPLLTPLLAILASILLLACAPDRINLSVSDRAWLDRYGGEIRIAPDPAYPPIESIDSKGKYNGIGADVMELVQKRLHVKFRLVHCRDWNEVLEKARKREVDILCAAERTPQRESFLSFTRPYLPIHNVVVIRNDHTPVHHPAELAGKHVGVTASHAIHELLARRFPQLELVGMPDDLATLKAVVDGKLEAAICSMPTVSNLIEERKIRGLTLACDVGLDYNLALAIRSDWPHLQRILEQTLDSISQEEVDTIRKKWIRLEIQSRPHPPPPEFPWKLVVAGIGFVLGIYVLVVLARYLARYFGRHQHCCLGKKQILWFGGCVLVLIAAGILFWAIGRRDPLTPEQRKWLALHSGVITLSPTPDFPPLSFYDAKGQPQGLTADYIALLEQDLGIHFRIVQPKSLTASLEGAHRGECDAYAAIQVTPEREAYLEFTSPFETIPVIMVCRQESAPVLRIEELAGKRVALCGGTALEEHFRLHCPGATVLEMHDDASALRAVSFREADIALTSSATTAYFIEKEGISNLRDAGTYPFVYQLRFAAPRDRAILSEILERGLARITSETRRDIRNRWIHLEGRQEGPGILVLAILGGLLLALLLVAAGVLAWNRTLARQVAQKTRELENEFCRRQETEAQLRQAQKMEIVGTLAGGIAHDFNNVLGGIVGTVSLLQFLHRSGDLPPDALTNHLETLEASGTRAAEMVQQLLSLARKRDLHLEPVDLRNVVHNVLRICSNTFDKSIRIDWSHHEGPALAMADSSQLEQVLLNICVNAAHAMTIMRRPEESQGGILSVTLSRQDEPDPSSSETGGSFWTLSIQDTGVGMDEETQSLIFDPFFTTKDKHIGTGLGLSMAYNIVSGHGGSILVTSRKGEGTTFRILLPRLAETTQDQSPPSHGDGPCRGEGLVLVIDDEEIMRTVAGQILRLAGYKVLLAQDGPEGIRHFRENQNELGAVLLDIAMPGMSGREVFLELQVICPTVPVLVTSGFQMDGRVHDVLRLGARGFIQKPYTLEGLTLAVKELFRDGCSRESGTA